jgi:glycosyltransferase involved in cell wall biosynthesis
MSWPRSTPGWAAGAAADRAVRVLAVSSYGGLGGAELALDAFLAHRPAHVDADVLLVADGPIRDRLECEGLTVMAARGMAGRPDPAALACFSRPFARWLRARRPDVVWAVGSKATLLCAPACRALGVPLVFHKVDFSFDRGLAPALAAVSDGVVSVSAAVLEALGPRLRRRRVLAVVGVPITLPERLPPAPDPDPPVIGTLARLIPYKGHDRILRAAALLSGEFPDLRVRLVGGPVDNFPGHPAELRALADRLGLGDRAELPGFVADVAAAVQEFSVFVSATYRDAEGFGVEALGAGIIEANWAGVPAVASREGGTAEALVDGVTGTLVEAAEPELLAAAIAPYLRDPGLRARHGAEGARIARERFRPEAAAGRLFDALRRAARPCLP